MAISITVACATLVRDGKPMEEGRELDMTIPAGSIAYIIGPRDWVDNANHDSPYVVFKNGDILYTNMEVYNKLRTSRRL